jgi:hypothetical protein
MRKLYFWIGVPLVAISGFYAYYLTQRHRCVGLSKGEITSIAREGLIGELSKEEALGIHLDPAVSPAKGKQATLVQFVNWEGGTSYDVAFHIPGDKEYWRVSVSAACGIRVRRVDEIYKPM